MKLLNKVLLSALIFTSVATPLVVLDNNRNYTTVETNNVDQQSIPANITETQYYDDQVLIAEGLIDINQNSIADSGDYVVQIWQGDSYLTQGSRDTTNKLPSHLVRIDVQILKVSATAGEYDPFSGVPYEPDNFRMSASYSYSNKYDQRTLTFNEFDSESDGIGVSDTDGNSIDFITTSFYIGTESEIIFEIFYDYNEDTLSVEGEFSTIDTVIVETINYSFDNSLGTTDQTTNYVQNELVIEESINYELVPSSNGMDEVIISYEVRILNESINLNSIVDASLGIYTGAATGNEVYFIEADQQHSEIEIIGSNTILVTHTIKTNDPNDLAVYQLDTLTQSLQFINGTYLNNPVTIDIEELAFDQAYLWPTLYYEVETTNGTEIISYDLNYNNDYFQQYPERQSIPWVMPIWMVFTITLTSIGGALLIGAIGYTWYWHSKYKRELTRKKSKK